MREAAIEMYLKPRGMQTRDEWLLRTFGDADPTQAGVQAPGLERLQAELLATEGEKRASTERGEPNA